MESSYGFSSPLILVQQMLARLENSVLAVLGSRNSGRRLGLHPQIVEIGFAERALDDLHVKRQIRGKLGVEGFEQVAAKLLPAGTRQP